MSCSCAAPISGATRTESVNTKIRLITRIAFGFKSSEEGTISWVGCEVRSSSAPLVRRVGSRPRCRLLRRLFGELVRDDVDQGPGVQVEQGYQVDVVAADLAGDEQPVRHRADRTHQDRREVTAVRGDGGPGFVGMVTASARVPSADEHPTEDFVISSPRRLDQPIA